MKPCLADANIVLSLLVPAHVHHSRVKEWFDGLEAGELAMCRSVQLAALRLLGNWAAVGENASVGVVAQAV